MIPPVTGLQNGALAVHWVEMIGIEDADFHASYVLFSSAFSSFELICDDGIGMGMSMSWVTLNWVPRWSGGYIRGPTGRDR